MNENTLRKAATVILIALATLLAFCGFEDTVALDRLGWALATFVVFVAAVYAWPSIGQGQPHTRST